MDIREIISDDQEALRTVIAGELKHFWTAMPVRLSEDTKNGHVATLQPTIKREVTDPSTGQVTYEDHPVHPDAPIHHLGGGGVSMTHPAKQGDTGLAIYASRCIDSWFQSDGTQQPIDYRMHSLGDAFYLSGARSQPRMLQQVAKDSSQLRSDDKKHVIDHDPQAGTHIKSVDPSTAPASQSFDPYQSATKFFEHFVKGAIGIHHGAVDSGTTHAYDLTHALGHVLGVVNGLHQILAHPTSGLSMLAENGLHSVLAHPQNGASLNALNALHSVLAHPSLGALLSAANGEHTVKATPGGVQISSSSGISLSAPSIGLPSGSISADAIAGDDNGNQLGGDLGGSLAQALVLGLTHVKGANLLPNAASDAAAASAGVPVGGLYRNLLGGVNVLCVRIA